MALLKPRNVTVGISKNIHTPGMGHLLELTRYITQEASLAPGADVWLFSRVMCLC